MLATGDCRHLTKDFTNTQWLRLKPIHYSIDVLQKDSAFPLHRLYFLMRCRSLFVGDCRLAAAATTFAAVTVGGGASLIGTGTRTRTELLLEPLHPTRRCVGF